MENKKRNKVSDTPAFQKVYGILGDGWKNFSYIFIFFVIFITYLIINGSATSWAGIMNIFRHTSTSVGIIALGMGIIIITGDIDLSVGAAVAIVASFTVEAYNFTNGNIILTLLFAILLGGLTGLVNGLLVGKVKVPAFIATLGTSLIFRSIATVILSGKGKPQYFVNKELSSWTTMYKIGNGDFLTIPIVTIIFIVLLLVILYLTKMTKFGKQIYAIGSNEKAAKLSGVNVSFVRVMTFVIAGLLVGVAGFIQVSRAGSITPSSLGVGYETDAIAAVVIGGIAMSGGRGNILGIFFGAISFMTADKLIVSLGANPLLNGIIRGGILLLAVILQLLQRKDK